VKLLPEGLSEGFALANLKLTVVSQGDLYPTTRTWRTASRPRPIAGQRLEYAFDVEPGELVVHLEHGIGRFLGLTEIEMDGRRTEVFTLEYAGGARLHVPTTHAHLLSRYIGPNSRKVKLHSLDGKRWRSEKEAAQRGIEDLAAGLLETQARRRVMPGFAFDLSDPWIAEFEALFPWQETPDQTRVIAEVKRDMASPMAMDRLLCGDAGYGKTEVAMRAAFIAVANHKQVALLAPTTVLAEQHFATFCDRMAHFPVRIEVLSRFRTPGQRAKTRAAAAQGQVDILIGTHALLTENIPFQDLGLLIIDEEQRFGVAHKERLKSLRALVDVLTMSATPIPRTLYLSLTGARDLSLLRTPPSNRVAVETLIQRDDDAVVAAAVRRELARGGQVFYLYNRVNTIGRVHERLRRVTPEARVLVAHGRMEAADLAATMAAFARGEADILLCTTIIESGIDIPRANTILIDRADRFGLADLYQLRGRVGRSAAKGFAYLLLPGEGLIDSDARKRLQALKRHSGLGAGYAIALRDLEIRGSGNLLGAAQSGHIAAIGFGLYCQLLRRTVARLKGEALPTLIDVELSLDFLDTSPGALGPNAAALPYDYIEDDAQRMNAYRRLAEAATLPEIDALRGELADRYGRPPVAAERALRLARLRIRAAGAHLAKIEARRGLLTFYARLNHAPVRHFAHLPLPDRPADALLDHIEALLGRLPRLA
ncbi:MAG TPA: transcription-repair coupling factor, partial [Candidatus Spyradenecus faecavium]|nr:transcription-repair coupling factor [Candidatus Spyradenecus faecavium]